MGVVGAGGGGVGGWDNDVVGLTSIVFAVHSHFLCFQIFSAYDPMACSRPIIACHRLYAKPLQAVRVWHW